MKSKKAEEKKKGKEGKNERKGTNRSGVIHNTRDIAAFLSQRYTPLLRHTQIKQTQDVYPSSFSLSLSLSPLSSPTKSTAKG